MKVIKKILAVLAIIVGLILSLSWLSSIVKLIMIVTNLSNSGIYPPIQIAEDVVAIIMLTLIVCLLLRFGYRTFKKKNTDNSSLDSDLIGDIN